MNTSEKGITLIKYFEGVHATPYRCPAGYWTIGVGHLISYDDKLHSSWDRTLSDNEIESLLKKDLIKYENGVTRLLHPKQPTQPEFDALVSSSPNKVTLLSSPPVSLSTGATFIDVADVEVL